MLKLAVEKIFERPWRLAILMIIAALAFVSGRMILFALLGLLIFISAIKTYFIHKKSYFMIIIPAILIALVLGIFYLVDYGKVASYIKDNYPFDLELVDNGVYEGVGQGLRGPIKVQVEIDDAKIKDIQIVQHQEMINALKGLPEKIIATNKLDVELVPPTIHGSIESSEGFREAVTNAVLKGIPDRPKFNTITQVINKFSQFRFGMTTWNALAILFCIILVFDYTLQPALVSGTGQALNCYNCQTCVGVCPVKIVDGEPYPMTMILAARLGDYEKVKRLAKYCVACSRCAGKCPVGDSGPSIAAAAITFMRKKL
ncbi:MAG TPA: 4Fe-4S dicluster domain-containing protein [bacterium]